MTDGVTAERSLAHNVVLNALAGLVAGGDVLANEVSRTSLRAAYMGATDQNLREDFEAALEHTRGVEAGRLVEIPSEHRDALIGVADAVLSALAADDVTLRVDHEAPLTVPSRDSYLYSFYCSGDPEVLKPLSLSPAIRWDVHEGAKLLSAGLPERAVTSFEAIVDDLGDIAIMDPDSEEDVVVARVLAALARHRASNDEHALGHLSEALHVDEESLAAKAIALAAGGESPDMFRAERFGARIFLRLNVDVPPESSVTPAINRLDRNGGWTDLTGNEGCIPISDLDPRNRLRIRLEGALPAFPVVYGYYVSLGVVDIEHTKSESVDLILLSGPVTEGVAETVALHN